ncbi:MAG: hypothetical protein JRK53_15065 [Deltaproteobacteria bacterium]|nr:hypothetical protein [Deltaproteobacteria bacterium]MBW1817158.1 hypothetical protein [Deltaproteobacteria bacterium]
MKKLLAMGGLVLFGLMLAQGVDAKINYRVLHHFNGADGWAPYGHLISVGNKLYGMTAGDTIRNMGMVFSIARDGSDYTILHHFEGKAQDINHPDDGDGQWPHGSLMAWGDTLYGITWAGGCYWNLCLNNDNTGCGTLFSQKTDGADYGLFWQFACGNGDDGLALPNAHFVSDGGRLYSTASMGGPHTGYGGGVFAIQPDGAGFQILHAFNENSTADGHQPTGGLALEGGVLYGTTFEGGQNGRGTVFSIGTDGAGFTTLHHFSGPDGAESGATPIVVEGRLYGVTIAGGAYGNGVVFSIGTDGSDYQVLHDFAVDESGPMEGVIRVGDKLYGATAGTGGNNTYGVIYSLRMDGSDYEVLHRFALSDGSWVDGRLLFTGRTFYGLASHGGDTGHGTIFAFDLPLPVPAVTPWGVAVLILLAGGAGFWGIRRKALKIEH